jgi:hypothetical protein
MLARLPAEAEAVADGTAGWAALQGGSAAAHGLGALAVRCVSVVSSCRPPVAEVCEGGELGVDKDDRETLTTEEESDLQRVIQRKKNLKYNELGLR